MKISQLISILEKAKEEHGDVEVRICNDDEGISINEEIGYYDACMHRSGKPLPAMVVLND